MYKYIWVDLCTVYCIGGILRMLVVVMSLRCIFVTMLGFNCNDGFI